MAPKRVFYLFYLEKIPQFSMHFNKTTLFLSVALLIALIAGCSKSYVDPSATAAADNDAAIKLYNTDTLKAQQVSSGLYYVVKTTNPTGKLPAVGDEVGYTYKISTLQNLVIDKRDTAIYTPFGTGGFITDEPLKWLRVGEYGVFLLPNYLAFGSQTITYTGGTLPAYSAVRLDLRLLSSRTEDEQIDQYVAQQKLTVTTKTASGLRVIKTVTNPTGATVTAGQTVKVNYVGRLIRGKTPFDSGPSLTVVLGQKQVIPGFEEGITNLRVGEKATIIFPSAQGYGATGVLQNNQYVIPPYAPLIFDIELPTQ